MTCQQLDEFQKESLKAYAEGKKIHKELHRTDMINRSLHCQMEADGRIYHRLENAQDMRVIELRPGRFNDVLICNLHVCSVEFEYPVDPLNKTFQFWTLHAVSNTNGQPVWYTAISYVWGNPDFIKPMICNGKQFFTTANLDIALRYLRHVDVAVMLWIDQICINQDDLEEKTEQVLLMSRIFAHAQKTLVWLGEESDDCRGALKTIHAVIDAFQYHDNEDWIPEPEDFERMFLPAPGSSKWSELGKFLARPWFQRVWIIQEIVFSKKIRFLCGKTYISWDDMTIFVLCMIKHDLVQYLGLNGPPQETSASDSACGRLLDIFSTQTDFANFTSRVSLLTSLVYGRGAQATDPRDKVFAVMGMTLTIINPDYTKATFDVYTEAAQSVQPTYMAEMLSCVDHDQPVTGRPSWVPDWSTPRHTTALGYSSSSASVYQNRRFSKLWPRPIRQEGKSLIVIGTLFDSISDLTAVASSKLKDFLIPTTATSRFITQSMTMATQQCTSYISSNTGGLFSAFWQTLVAGKDKSGKMKAPNDEFAPIFSLLFDCATGQSPSIPDQPPPHPNPRNRLTLDKLNFRRPKRTYRQMELAFSAAVTARRFATTKKGYMGLTPRGAMLGDEIAVILGASVPFLVRRVVLPHEHNEARNDRYQLLGECYLHGIMSGEVMASMPESEMREIELV